MLGGVACALVVAVLVQAGGEFPFFARTGLAQMLRQSAWQQALATYQRAVTACMEGRHYVVK